MVSIWAKGFLAALSASVASAACSSNLVIDNFARQSTNTNNLGGWTSGEKRPPSSPLPLWLLGSMC